MNRHFTLRCLTLAALISAFFLTLASCGGTYREYSGLTWGTSFHIVYQSSRDLSAEMASEMARIDSSLSMFNPSSTISRINAGATDTADAYVAEVFALSQKVWKLSGGAFDPTVAPLVDLWGFGRSGSSALAPNDSAIAAVLPRVGLGGCSLSDDGRVITRKSPATEFDFSAIAKGYGVDCVARVLRENGVSNYMVEIGGEILLEGHNPRVEAWRIQIDAPVADNSGNIHEALTIRAFGPERTAIASSGNYRNFFSDSTGRRYGHTISPLTGRSHSTPVAAATIIHPGSCAFADALATACMALPPEDIRPMLEKVPEAAAFIITAAPDSTFTVENFGRM